MLRAGGILFTGAAALAMLLPVEAEAQQPQRADTSMRCSGTVLHFAQRGFAFECIDSRGTVSDIVVVRDGPFPGRVEMVVDLLREANSRGQAAGRTRGTQGMWITPRPADAQAQAICGQITRRFPGGDCVIAVDIAYR